MKLSAQHNKKYMVYGISYIASKFPNIQNTTYNIPNKAGFTLIEVLVAATILATLIGGVVLSLNPLGQINKSQDAQRVSDIQSVKTALELYYSDHKCYPTEVPFGQEWRVQSGRGVDTVYMKEVPQDPKCTDATQSTCYRYRTDSTSSCPQWNVVFAQLSKNSALTNTCALSSLSNCAPSGYTGSAWACTLSGAVNCDNLLATSLVGGAESVSPTATPIPPPSATPTPTPTPPAGSATYDTANPPTMNPDIYQTTIMPLAQNAPLGQAIRVNVADDVGNVISVKLLLISDGEGRNFTLDRRSGTATNGTWEGAWQVTDTYCDKYGYAITATDDKGNTQTNTIMVDTNGWCH